MTAETLRYANFVFRAGRKGGLGGIPPRPLFSAFAFFAGVGGHADIVGAPPYIFFIASDPFVEIMTGTALFAPITYVATFTISPFLAN